MYDPAGLIMSPGFPLGYINNHISSFDLEPSSVSCYDYLDIYETNNQLALLCGNVTSGLIASSSNYMYIRFIADSSSTYKGFNATYYIKNLIIVNTSSGSIVSPAYLNNQNNVWKIEGGVNTFIILRITFIDLGPVSPMCTNDYLQILGGEYDNPRQLARPCGNVAPGLIASSSNVMYVVFRSDSFGTYQGFNATYYTKNINTMTAPSGSIESPVNLIDQNNIWNIAGGSNTFIILSITSIDLSPLMPTCSNDSLQIFNGPSTGYTKLATLCGNVVPGLIASTSNYMFIVFRTDSSYTYRGFRATYIIKNITTLTAPSGSIESPVYLSDQNNIWKIDGGSNTFIIFSITSIDLSPLMPTCSNDSLHIFDGPSTGYTKLATQCGNVVPDLIASTSNYMFIVFRTDSSYTYRGFRATYTTQKSSTVITTSPGYIISPGFPYYFPTNNVYTWTIQGNVGSFVVLNITTLQLSSSPSSCPNHFIQVYDGQNTSGVSLGRYCYSSSPVYVVSSSNNMHVVFRTDSTTTNKGFYSNYFTLACLNTLYGTSGVITSSGYPSSYNKYSSCSWRIVGDAGTRIFINITDFDVSPCESAFVLAYDGQNTRDNLYLPRCGQVPVFSTTSSSNFVFIVFITSGLINSVPYRGFKLNYVIKDIPYGKFCSELNKCQSYLTCVNNYCSCPNDNYHNNSTLSCHNILKFKEKCVVTEQCRNTLQCLNGICYCDRGFYFSPDDDRCNPSLDHTSICNSSISGMCKPANSDCLPDVNGNQRCLCIDRFYFESKLCVSSSIFIVQRPQLTTKSTTGVELQWEATTLGPNRTYGVSWVSASDETDRGTQAANESGVTVTGLTPGTSYTITVYTFLQQQGFYSTRNVSTTINIITNAAQPGLVNTELSQLDKPPYVIRFQPSEGRVDLYKFSLKSTYQFQNFTVTSPEIKLSDLQADTEYNYSIKAVNSVRDESSVIEGSFKTPNSDALSSELNIGLIAGATVGSLVFVILLVLLIILILRRNSKSIAESRRNARNTTDNVLPLSINRPQAKNYSRPSSVISEQAYANAQQLPVNMPQSHYTEYDDLTPTIIERSTTLRPTDKSRDNSQHNYVNIKLPH
ncbi:cubilin-like [Physella acuta]|uniref:cubilin-like n=1 Tax=Physella acuta TaxID=109671 RepID=UPI0027DC15A2|nr:cubilin-like [Physella acuta]